MWYHMIQLSERAPTSIGVVINMYIYLCNNIARWILPVDINNNVSVMFTECILIVGIKNSGTVKFENLIKAYAKSVE